MAVGMGFRLQLLREEAKTKKGDAALWLKAGDRTVQPKDGGKVFKSFSLR